MGDRRRVLMIDDDEGLTELVKEYLAQHDFDLRLAHDAAAGVATLAKDSFDLVILDVMLPGKDGFVVCQEIRRTSDVPILMLSARGATTDRVKGLELGADDYLAKPFEPVELLARLQAILRRGRRVDKSGTPLRFGELVLDLGARTATLADQTLPLTTAEFDLLALFASRPQETLSRDVLSQTLRGTEWAAFNRTFDVVLSRLRQKLGDDPKNPRWLKTIWGTGYMFIGRPE